MPASLSCLASSGCALLHAAYRHSRRYASGAAIACFGAVTGIATAPVAADSATLPAAAFTAADDAAERLETYLDQVAKVRSIAMQRGSVTYSEVLCAAYSSDSHLDLDLVLAQKSAWRDDQGESFTFLTDYSTLSKPASVSEVEPTRNRHLGSTLIGRYEPRAHAIKIAHSAGDFAIIHEAGHALQHEALRDRSIRRANSIAFTDFERSLRSSSEQDGVDKFAARRLRYLASQDELEVRLQDLNRFNAILLGRGPIMNPHDTVRALSALGMPLDAAAVALALSGSSWSASSDDISELIAQTAPVSRAHARLFEDAYELIMMRRLTSKVDETLWPNLLRKLLFEAPGHL